MSRERRGNAHRVGLHCEERQGTVDVLREARALFAYGETFTSEFAENGLEPKSGQEVSGEEGDRSW